MVSPYSADDYTTAFRRLLPRGRVWPTDAVTTQAQVLGCLAPTMARLDSAAVDLIADAFPATTVSFIDEWEAALGLPDPCLGANPTVDQRRDQIMARFAGAGGQSIPIFIAFAALLGFVITITEFAPFRAGRSRVGQPLNGADWAFAWKVTIVSGATSADHALFRVGQNRTGDPLASSSSAATALECEMRKMAPAHTILFFSF